MACFSSIAEPLRKYAREQKLVKAAPTTDRSTLLALLKNWPRGTPKPPAMVYALPTLWACNLVGLFGPQLVRPALLDLGVDLGSIPAQGGQLKCRATPGPYQCQ